MNKIDSWKNKKVLITGVCGTIGSELVKQLSSTDVDHIVGIDNSETELFFISERYSSKKNIDFFLCDLRDSKGLNRAMHGIDIVLHAAALKHVVLCEKSPRDAVSTNIQGMINMIDAAELNNVKRFIFTSSANPSIAAASIKAIEVAKKSENLREDIRQNSDLIRAGLRELEIPHLNNDSHIIPIHLEDPRLCKEAANLLIEEHGIYIQPVFYPTVPKGDERFRVTITPKHQAEDIE